MFTAETVRVVWLGTGEEGEDTVTVMTWLMESEAVEGTGFGGDTLTTVQVPEGKPEDTIALTWNVEA